jgi:hypothetical protein
MKLYRSTPRTRWRDDLQPVLAISSSKKRATNWVTAKTWVVSATAWVARRASTDCVQRVPKARRVLI